MSRDPQKPWDFKDEFRGECGDCGVLPGQTHLPGCDVERCSVCGGQAISCDCEGHNPFRSVWTGVWPESWEAAANGYFARWVRRDNGEPIEFGNFDVPGKWHACKAEDLGSGPGLNDWAARDRRAEFKEIPEEWLVWLRTRQEEFWKEKFNAKTD